jgi:hypothetical protein
LLSVQNCTQSPHLIKLQRRHAKHQQNLGGQAGLLTDDPTATENITLPAGSNVYNEPVMNNLMVETVYPGNVGARDRTSLPGVRLKRRVRDPFRLALVHAPSAVACVRRRAPAAVSRLRRTHRASAAGKRRRAPSVLAGGPPMSAPRAPLMRSPQRAPTTPRAKRGYAAPRRCSRIPTFTAS